MDKGIECVGEREVFDITTSKHYFSANGIYVHNSWQEAFIMSGNCRFNTAALKEIEKEDIRPGRNGFFERVGANKIRFVPDENGWVTIFDEPVPNKQYCCGADPCQGIQVDAKDKRKTDENGVQIVRVDNLEQVCEIRNRHEPDIISDEIVMACLYFNNAFCGVERNKERSVILKVMESYNNIYFEERFDDERGIKKRNVGWFTTKSNKMIMIAHLDQMIRELRLKIRSADLLSQMRTFVRNPDGSSDAQEGCKDDLVMSLMICLQMCLCTPVRGRIQHGREPGKFNDSWRDVDENQSITPGNQMLDRAFQGKLKGGMNYFNR